MAGTDSGGPPRGSDGTADRVQPVDTVIPMVEELSTLILRPESMRVQITNPASKIEWYRGSTRGVPNVRHGPSYYDFRSDPTEVRYQELTIADLGFATLLDGRPSADAAQSIAECPMSIAGVPDDPLETLDVTAIPSLAAEIARLCRLRGWGPAVSTKTLHIKRRATVPVLDSKAIFGTYMNPRWQRGDEPKSRYPTWSTQLFIDALTNIHRDLTRHENIEAWSELTDRYPEYTRIELFDMVWWSCIHQVGPAAGSA